MNRLKSILSDKDRRWDILLSVYVLALLVFLAFNVRDSFHVNDEVIYSLMVDSLSKGSFTFENGYGSLESRELVMHSTVRCEGGLCPQYPPLYQLMMQPIYQLLGLWGLFFANTLCFCATLVVVYLLSNRLIFDRKVAFFSVLVYSLSVYSIKYSIELWPHMLSVLLATSSFYLVLDGRRMALAGFLLGLASGVRYQNILFSIVIVWYILRKYGLKKSAHYMAGLILPVATIMSINFSMYGGILDTGYSAGRGVISYAQSHHGFKNFHAYLAVLTVIAYATYFAAKDVFKSEKPAVLAVGVLLLFSAFFYALDSEYPERLLLSAKIVYAQLIDIHVHPAQDVIPMKRSLLQANPIMVLGLLSPLLLVKKLDTRDIKFLYMPLVVLLVFYSIFNNMHGGRVAFVRYLLESLPLMSVLASYTVWEVLEKKLSAETFSLSLLFSIAFFSLGAYKFFSNTISELFVRYIPLAMAFILGSCFLSCIRWEKGCRLLLYLTIMSLSFGFTVNAIDTITSKVMREHVSGLTESLDFIGDGSAVFMGHSYELAEIGMLKYRKNVTIVDTFKDDQAEALEILEYYRSRNVQVYLYDRNVTEFKNFIRYNLTGYGLREKVLDWGRLRVYAVD